MAKVTLSELVERHDLLSASIVCLARGDGTVLFSCALQWAGENERECAAAHGGTESEALRGALANMTAKRTPDLELVA